jgi:hypothetical protein
VGLRRTLTADLLASDASGRGRRSLSAPANPRPPTCRSGATMASKESVFGAVIRWSSSVRRSPAPATASPVSESGGATHAASTSLPNLARSREQALDHMIGPRRATSPALDDAVGARYRALFSDCPPADRRRGATASACQLRHD